MNRSKNLRGQCQQCGGLLEFPAEAAGTQGQCPHCGAQTDLLLAAPPEVPSVPRRAILYAIVAILILAFGVGGLLALWRRAKGLLERRKQRQQQRPPPSTGPLPSGP